MMPPVFSLCCFAGWSGVACNDVMRREVGHRGAKRYGTISTVPRNRTEALLPVALRCRVMRCDSWRRETASCVMSHRGAKRLRSTCRPAGRPQLFCAVLIVSPADLHLLWMSGCFCGACWRFVWPQESRVWHRALVPAALSDRCAARYP